MKRFNTTAVCVPEKHYMVDLTSRVIEIKKLVDDGKYFIINRARQYGKTTTLTALKKVLIGEYEVISIDFQGIGNAGFSTEEKFVQEFCRLIWNSRRTYTSIDDKILDTINVWKDSDNPRVRLGEFFDLLMEWCERADKGIVLMIDEVDSATNNQVFLDFLAQLRKGYISRDTDNMPTFQSVILAGVTDIKYLKSMMRQGEDVKVNSPWNIAADFDIDMSLSESGIKAMLDDYKIDHNSMMNTEEVAHEIREYTNGYPFLVSRICELIDTKVMDRMGDKDRAWTIEGIDEAVKMILEENNTLFQSLIKNLDNNSRLKETLRSILMNGTRKSWNYDQDDIARMKMYGFIRNENNAIRIDNRKFETRLYNLFLSDEEMKSNVFYIEGDSSRNIFVEDGILNIRLVLEHFIQTFHEIYGSIEDTFKEKDGRELFLLYLKPIINGTGNYYIEAQTRDQRRTDVIVDYLGQRYVIEMKIWHGQRYNEDGERQISEYLDYFGLTTGYMLSFNFNKHKEIGVKRVTFGDKVLYEGTV